MAGEHEVDEVTPLLGSATAQVPGQDLTKQGSSLRPLVFACLAPTSFVKLCQARVAVSPHLQRSQCRGLCLAHRGAR